VFGYEKGAFTGALARKAGLAETANGGTLFLDEIGDVPLGMQVKLLRLIESGTYRRVGGVETLRSDFRLVAATHKPLARMVAEGQFRQDLYYRIAAFPLLPSLRERHGDIGLLAESLLQRGGSSGVRLAPDALAALDAYHWPGNIRELRNVIERARLFADDGEIRPSTWAWASACRCSRARAGQGRFYRFCAKFGARKALAVALGCSERTLYRRLKEEGLA
jgi:transcriptional regulator with PAS, ATPase and Fis domain